ncbi:MAG: hypothetical protein KJN63_03215 [Acidimicrobiia bacterium]|nr:hypothetical protein [Acidimicrobiia bacterium]
MTDDAWLVGVERRDSGAEAAAGAEGVFADRSVGSWPGDTDPTPADSVDSDSQTPTIDPSEQSAGMPSEQDTSTYPDLGMVYAGLDDAGVALFPSEVTVDPEPEDVPLGLFPSANPTETLPGIESGPTGPEAAVHLATLDLSVGCTWEDVTTARRRVLDSLTDGSAEAWNTRLEVNHACASLRLLRVGPLKY